MVDQIISVPECQVIMVPLHRDSQRKQKSALGLVNDIKEVSGASILS